MTGYENGIEKTRYWQIVESKFILIYDYVRSTANFYRDPLDTGVLTWLRSSSPRGRLRRFGGLFKMNKIDFSPLWLVISQSDFPSQCRG